MFHEPEFWVAVAVVLFLVLIAKPMSRMAAKALDAQAEKIKFDLDEAKRLQTDAHELLSLYQRKQREAAGEAEAIIAHAKSEAERMDREGRERLAASLERREKLAKDRIALAEQQAIDRVRARAVEVAVLAAQAVLAANLSPSKADALIDDAIGQLPGRLH